MDKKTCPRLYTNSNTLTYDKEYKYWKTKEKYFSGDIIQKGLDSTSVNSKKWNSFKKKYGFKLIKKASKRDNEPRVIYV